MAGQSDYILGYLDDVDLRLLRIFAAIVDCGGITAAETELNMANSTLSTHLASLEERLQLKLCRRGRSGFALTAEGKRVYDSAQRMFGSLEEFRRSVRSARPDSPGELSIVVPDFLLLGVLDQLTPVLRRYTAELPGVFIDIDIASPAQIDQLVIDGKVDLGINASSRRTHNLRFRDIKQEVAGLYCGKGHPLFDVPDSELSVEKVLEHDVVRAHGYYYPKRVLRALRGATTASCIPLDGRVLLMATGRYLGILAEEVARPFVSKGTLRELLPDTFRYEYSLSIITRAESDKPALTRFLALLDERLNDPHLANS